MDIKKTAELVMIGGMLVISTANTAAQAASISPSASATVRDVTSGEAGGYVLEAFKLNLSANVSLAYDGNATAVAVKSASQKGMHTFGGTSNGGSVKQCEATSLASPTASLSVDLSDGC